MGIMLGHVEFDDRAPPLADICSAATEICGLPVVVLESTDDEIHDSIATIAFACAPDVPLTVYTSSGVFGSQPAGTQTVCLEGFLGQERTLIVATALALESLGGVPYGGISDDDRQEFGKQISESELEARQREAERQARKLARTTVFMLPILIPMGIIVTVWSLITAPFEFWWRLRRHKKA